MLAGIVLGFVVLVVVRPALAQEASSSAPVNGSSSTSTQPTQGDPSTALIDSTSAGATSADSSTATTVTDTESTSDTGQTSQPSLEQAPAGLAKVHIIGTKYIDYFTDGSSEYAFPGDPAIDAHLAEKDAPIPTHTGMTWVHTTGQPLYDTQSGDLEVGQYAVQPGGTMIAKYSPFVSSTSTSVTTGSPEPESSPTASPEVLGGSTTTDAGSLGSSSAPTTDPDETLAPTAEPISSTSSSTP